MNKFEYLQNLILTGIAIIKIKFNNFVFNLKEKITVAMKKTWELCKLTFKLTKLTRKGKNRKK